MVIKTKAYVGTWTQLNDSEGNKVVVFLPENQECLQDKRRDIGRIIEIELTEKPVLRIVE
jgi:hypothetical protein